MLSYVIRIHPADNGPLNASHVFVPGQIDRNSFHRTSEAFLSIVTSKTFYPDLFATNTSDVER